MDVDLYEERQWFAGWVYLLVIVCVGGAVLATVAVGAADQGQNADVIRWVGAGHVVLMLVILNLLFVITRVSNRTLYVRLGLLFPCVWKRIPVADIDEYRCVEYRPLRDAGGWGVRFGRFEGSRCRFYNARGNRGILIVTSERRYIIGSQDPERLAAAIEEAAGAS